VRRRRRWRSIGTQLSGDPNAKVDASTVVAKIKVEYQKLSPFLDLEAVREPQGSRTKHRLTTGSRAVEQGRCPGA
jgi:hypothetical protein